MLISRSSGAVCGIGVAGLWSAALLQCAPLLFFMAVGAWQVAYGRGLMLLCVLVGLLGGAVYVNAFTLVSRHVQQGMVEMSLSAASVADTSGIMLSALGVQIQRVLYAANGIHEDPSTTEQRECKMGSS